MGGDMAYMSQEKKKEIAAELKKVIPQGWKYSLGVRDHSTLELTISQAPIDLVTEYLAKARLREINRGLEPYNEGTGTHAQVNPYWLDEYFEGERLAQIKAIFQAMNNGNHDRSDAMTDYFDVGWYVTINFGRWDRPFKVAA
jgi:hypothetical protein